MQISWHEDSERTTQQRAQKLVRQDNFGQIFCWHWDNYMNLTSDGLPISDAGDAFFSSLAYLDKSVLCISGIVNIWD